MQPQAQGHQMDSKAPEAGRRQEGFPYSFLREQGQLDFGLLASRLREYISVLSHPVCGTS